MNPLTIARWTVILGWLAALVCAVVVECGGTAPSASLPGVAPAVAAKGSTCEAPEGALFNPCARLDASQVIDIRGGVCDAVAAEVFASQDYLGTPVQRACLGLEDDARVGLALDYGLTQAGYAAAERAGLPN